MTRPPNRYQTQDGIAPTSRIGKKALTALEFRIFSRQSRRKGQQNGTVPGLSMSKPLPLPPTVPALRRFCSVPEVSSVHCVLPSQCLKFPEINRVTVVVSGRSLE
ncbi:unnamed protein product, partial [Ectocarpus fasciculatus]